MQIKTPMRYALTQVRKTNIKKSTNKKCPLDSPPGQLVLMALEVYDMIFTFCFLGLGRASPGPNIEDGKCLGALCPPLVYLFYCSKLHSVHSVTQSCPTLCDPMNRSTPGLPVHHQLPEFTQTHVHRVSDAIQPSNPLLSPSPPAPNPSQHQSLFQ